MDYTDNVVEFMAQDLRNLPKEVLTRCVLYITHLCDNGVTWFATLMLLS